MCNKVDEMPSETFILPDTPTSGVMPEETIFNVSEAAERSRINDEAFGSSRTAGMVLTSFAEAAKVLGLPKADMRNLFALSGQFGTDIADYRLAEDAHEAYTEQDGERRKTTA